jgi:hypothetical protein
MVARNEDLLVTQAIQTLIQHFQINRVIYVDDYFEERFEVEPMIGWLSDQQNDNLPQAQEIFTGIPFDADHDIWAQAFRNYWGNLRSANQKEIAINVARILGKSLSQDNIVVGKFPGIFPGEIQVVLLSPTQWMIQKEDLLLSVSPQAKAMCFFDQDLSWARGFTDTGPRSGIGLVQEIIQHGNHDNVICCLLTHTITSLDGEMDAWRHLAKSNSLKLHEFLPLAKLRLSNGESPVLFADGLKKAALNLHVENIKKIAINIVKKGSQLAIQEFQNLDVYDFDQMVLQSSYDDGVWEAETLMRIYQIFQKDSFTRAMLGLGNSRKMAQNFELARRLNEVDLNGILKYGYPQVKPIRRKELFEENNVLLHSPLETGDIFSSLDEQKLFVLLGQPCDLLMRKDGARNNPNLAVPLVLIEKESATKKFASSYWKTHAKLDYYFVDRQNIAIISFAKSFHVDVEVLDLAVIHTLGLCEIDIRKQKRRMPSNRFTPGWIIRTRKLIETFSNYEQDLKTFKTHLRNITDQDIQRKIWQAAMPKISITDLGLAVVPYENGVFNFGLKRIGRIRQPGAERLLKSYTQYLSRDADEVDFAEGV